MEKSIQSLFIMIITAGFFLLSPACSSTTPSSQPASGLSYKPTTPKVFDHSHSNFDFLLKKYVCNGWVDYKGILSEKTVFYEYIDTIGNVEASVLTSWTREQKLAFWINAYNAFTIQAVIERYPIKERSLIGLFYPQNSILQISGIWSRLKFKAGRQNLTLGYIEHDILRKSFHEPRIHFAIACASRSCPDLRAEAYRTDILEMQFNDQTFQFINNPTKGTFWDTANKRLYISKIFKWFKEDFEKKSGIPYSSTTSPTINNPLIRFISPYILDEDVKDSIADNQNIKVSYLPYDWQLNDKAEKPCTVTQKKIDIDE